MAYHDSYHKQGVSSFFAAAALVTGATLVGPELAQQYGDAPAYYENFSVSQAGIWILTNMFLVPAGYFAGGKAYDAKYALSCKTEQLVEDRKQKKLAKAKEPKKIPSFR